MPTIFVFSEQERLLGELLAEGRRLAADPLTAVVTSDALAAAAATAGADHVVLLRIPSGQPLETAASTLADLVKDADIFLLGATQRGKDLAARVAARLEVPLATDAIALREAGGSLEIERLVFGGCGVSTQTAVGRPQMATVPAGTCAAGEGISRGAAIREVPVPADPRVRIVEQRPTARGQVDIAAARAVVGVGRGLGKQDDLALVEALAGAMGGAVGCTRPLAEDLSWMSEDRYIGISGRKVAPSVYLAVGLSGQVQHVAGVRDAKCIVAINKDENAPVFKHADYGLVGDLYSVVPALTAELGKRLG